MGGLGTRTSSVPMGQQFDSDMLHVDENNIYHQGMRESLDCAESIQCKSTVYSVD